MRSAHAIPLGQAQVLSGADSMRHGFYQARILSGTDSIRDDQTGLLWRGRFRRTHDDGFRGFRGFRWIDRRLRRFAVAVALFLVRLDALRHFVATRQYRSKPLTYAGGTDIRLLLREVQRFLFHGGDCGTEHPIDHRCEKTGYRRFGSRFGRNHDFSPDDAARLARRLRHCRFFSGKPERIPELIRTRASFVLAVTDCGQWRRPWV